MAVLSDADIKSIVDAMLGVLKKGGKALLEYSEAEAAKFAHSIEVVTALTISGQISEAEARAQIDLQKSAAQTVLTSIEGITLILAGQAINAGLGAVGAIVNKAIGFALLPVA